jgi:transcriptional regulator with XRE-family HTH domain
MKRKSRARRKQTRSRKTARKDFSRAVSELRHVEDRPFVSLFTDLAAGLTAGALRLAADTAGVPLRMAEALLLKPEQLKLLAPEQRRMMRETGLYLRDLRQLAGLTVADLSHAMDLKEHTLLEAVEHGTATLSFELILRLAALLARHDPVPFVIRFVRTYNPEVWTVLERWGITRVPVQFEREREFVNIFRRHDAARRLSDKGFEEVLKFTVAAFEMSLHFAAAQEGVVDEETGA